MPVIRIDDEVWKYLQQRARPLVDNPNDVLRRILGLDEKPLQEKNKLPENEKEVDTRIMNNRNAALIWLREQMANPHSPIYSFLRRHNADEFGISYIKNYVRVSQYYTADKSYPGIPVWWLQIPLKWDLKSKHAFPFVFLLCQKMPNDFSDFWCLAVPFEYLNSEHSNGNLGTLGNNICLHLSCENCRYRGYEVKMFDDVRLTMVKGQKPIPFGQFLVI